MPFWQSLAFWTTKTSQDNAWRPQPGQSPTKYQTNLPTALQRTDPEATVVDAAPFITAAAAVAHVSQIHSFGFTVPASVFRNVRTLTVTHRATLYLTPVILACQAAGLPYRYLIPRFAPERELRRDEEIVRRDVDVGMTIGAMMWTGRMIFRVGMRYWAPIEIVMGGALADLMQREYIRAHGL